MKYALFVLGAVAGLYGLYGYTQAPTVLQQQAAGHFLVVAAVFIGCGAVVEAVDHAGAAITRMLRRSAESATDRGAPDPPAPPAG